MARVKRAVNAHKKRRVILERASGYRGQRSRLYRKAKEQVIHSHVYSFNDRRKRKGDFRRLWIQRINAGARANGLTYNRFVQGLGLAGVDVDRRMLAELAVHEPATFAALVETAKAVLPEDTSAPSVAQAAENDLVAHPPVKSMYDAVQAAQSEFAGDVLKIELEREDDERLEYTVVLVSHDTKYEVTYDANTLAKLDEETEDVEKKITELRKKTFDVDNVLSVTVAANAARKQQDGAIIEWELESTKAGRVHYEFEILPAGSSDDIEIKIDAIDGTPL